MAKTETKNSRTATGEYYDGKVETIDYLEYMLVKLLENNMAPERAYDVVCALKYLSPRLGAKADQPIELFRRKWRQFELFRKKAKELE